MPVMNNNAGTSLIELLLAAVLVAITAATLSTVFPKASANAVRNKQRWVAANLASAQIESLKSQPYAFVNVTSSSSFNASNFSCDCRIDDFSAIPSTSSVAAGTTFNLKSCVGFITYLNPPGSNLWLPRCPQVGDAGSKSILVRVSWSNGAQTLSMTEETLMTRS